MILNTLEEATEGARPRPPGGVCEAPENVTVTATRCGRFNSEGGEIKKPGGSN